MSCMELLDDNDETIIDFICERCIEAGPVGTAARMQTNIERLRKLADNLEQLAPKVAAITDDNWATLEDMRTVEREFEEQMEAEYLQELEAEGRQEELEYYLQHRS